MLVTTLFQRDGLRADARSSLASFAKAATDREASAAVRRNDGNSLRCETGGQGKARESVEARRPRDLCLHEIAWRAEAGAQAE